MTVTTIEEWEEWESKVLLQSDSSFLLRNITKTSPCNEHPLTLHFYIVKMGLTGVYLIFLFLLQNIGCGYSLEPPH